MRTIATLIVCLFFNVSFAETKLGINIQGACDWCCDYTFVDTMKQARGFANLTNPANPLTNPAPVDSKGWPMQDFGVFFASFGTDPLNRPLSQTNPSFFGTYTLSFNGQATLGSQGCNKFTNKIYNSITNTTTAQLNVDTTCVQIDVEFTGTKRTATSATNTGLTNIQLLRPGYALGTTQVFTTQFLTALQSFSTIRFMAMLDTNGSVVSSWSERTPQYMPSQKLNTVNGVGSKAILSGVSWEYIIQLANQTNKDIWINIPEGVDLTDPTSSNYVTQLATLLKNNLNSNIHVYVEYSNELWNTRFTQAAANYSSASSEVNSGADKTLNYDSINDPMYWAMRRIAHQTLRISQLFAGVYGPAAINTTIRPVYANSYQSPFYAEDGLEYLYKVFGTPKNYLYAIASAPYFGITSSYTDVNSFFTSILGGANNVVPGFSGTPAYSGVYPLYTGITYQSLANYAQLKNISYEGGPDVSALTNQAIPELANNDQRMGNLVKNYLADAFDCGNDLFMFFELQGSTTDPLAVYHDFAVPTQKSNALLSFDRQKNTCKQAINF